MPLARQRSSEVAASRTRRPHPGEHELEQRRRHHDPPPLGLVQASAATRVQAAAGLSLCRVPLVPDVLRVLGVRLLEHPLGVGPAHDADQHTV